MVVREREGHRVPVRQQDRTSGGGSAWQSERQGIGREIGGGGRNYFQW